MNPSLLIRLLLSLIAVFGPQIQAQTQLPVLDPVAVLEATAEEIQPDGPNTQPLRLQFGIDIATFGGTVLVGIGEIDRVAVFTRNKSGVLTRTGTLQPDVEDSGFGDEIALGINVALVRGANDVYVFRRGRNTFTQTQKLSAAAGEQFGKMAIDFPFVAISTHDTVEDTGAVDIYFVDVLGKLRRLKRVVASDAVAGDRFGADLALQLNVLVVGAPGANGHQGAVYLFNLLGRTQTESQKLLAIDGAPNDSFGASVAIEDGVLAVGATGVNANPGTGTSGAVYIFSRSGRSYIEVQKLTDPSNTLSQFGARVVVNRAFLAVSSSPFVPFFETKTVLYRRDGPLFDAKAVTSPDIITNRLVLDRATLYRTALEDRNSPGFVAIYDLRQLSSE